MTRPMKVLHVIDALGVGGGAEHSLITMLPEYAARGVESEIVCLNSRTHGLFEDAQAMGVPYQVLSGRRAISRVLALRKIIRDRQPDLVHATLVNSSLLTRWACLGLPTRQLHSLVNTTYDESRVRHGGVSVWKLELLRLVDLWTAKTVRGRFHAITHAVKDEAVGRLSIPSLSIDVVPRARSAKMLGSRTRERSQAVRERMGCQDTDIIVLNLGRQDWIKAQDVIVRGFDLAARSEPRLRLWIAGRDGDASHVVKTAIQEAKHKDRIELLGHRTDVADLITAADLFVVMSHHEGFGGVLLEAMALECPIIASDAACFREVLNDGELGILTARGDANLLGAALVRLARDTAQRGALASAGLEAFHQRYSLATIADQMVEVYAKASRS